MTLALVLSQLVDTLVAALAVVLVELALVQVLALVQAPVQVAAMPDTTLATQLRTSRAMSQEQPPTRRLSTSRAKARVDTRVFYHIQLQT